MKKKMPLFYKIYFSLLVLFAVALAAGCLFLHLYIKDYNNGIHETVSRRFFEETFLNLNTEKIIELSGIRSVEFESEDDLKKYISESLSEETLTYTSVSNTSDDITKKYIVKSGDYKIATFTLKPDTNNDYYVDTVKLHLPASLEKNFRILDSSKLYINGVEVSDKYITDTTPHENAKYLPENITAPMWVTYSVTGLTKEPEYSVTDRNGATPELTDIDGTFTENILPDPDEKEITARLLDAAKQYAKCMQNDASKASVFKYFKKNTDLYNSIKTAENMFVWDHSGFSFEDVSVTEFFRYDENTVSCRISFTHLLHKYGRADYKDFTDITYFAENIDGEYMIFARHNN